MWRVEGGASGRYCDGVSRRSFVQLGLAGLGTLGLADVLRARERTAALVPASTAKQTSLILLWLDGGPSHMDTYDLKPLAPPEYRGIWQPIATNVPGIEITELFPKQARLADKFSILRSMHHGSGDHFTGGHWMLCGRHAGVSGASTAGRHPFFGAVCSSVLGARQPGMPANVAVPYAASIGLRPGYFGGHYLGAQHNPFATEGDPNNDNFQVRNVNLPPALSIDRLENRRKLLKTFDTFRREADASGVVDSLDQFNQQAFDMIAGNKAREAFDLSREDAATRDRYGRHTWGQSTLLARRLVEAGSTVVTCHFGGWDHHWNLEQGYNQYLPRIDALVSSLLEDLDQRGLLDEVLVVLCGEFSRTPRMNDGGNGGPPGSMGTPGRDHWGAAMSVLVAGGGTRGGQVIGATNSRGEVPIARPLLPGDLHHTIFRVLGVDPTLSFTDHAGRPTPAIDHGAVISELF